MRHKRQRPDYKSYCLDKYALRYAKCALVRVKIENSSGVWRGDIQEQRGTFEACGQAAYRGWVVRFERGKWAWFLAPFSFVSFSFGRAKENENWT